MGWLVTHTCLVYLSSDTGLFWTQRCASPPWTPSIFSTFIDVTKPSGPRFTPPSRCLWWDHLALSFCVCMCVCVFFFVCVCVNVRVGVCVCFKGVRQEARDVSETSEQGTLKWGPCRTQFVPGPSHQSLIVSRTLSVLLACMNV